MNTRVKDSMLALAEHLNAAANDEDWPTLARLDREVAALLNRIQPAPVALQSALACLQAAHQQASQRANDHARDLASRMEEMQDNSEGLRAYELSGEIV